MKNRNLALAVAAAAAIFLTACGGTAIPAETVKGNAGNTGGKAEVTIRYGNIYPADTTFGKAIDGMAAAINQESKGTVNMEVFHGGTLGSEQDHVEAVREGSLEMMQTGTAGISRYLPETALFELWYSYDKLDTVVNAFQSVVPELDKAYQEQGFKLLGAFYNGPRSIISTKPIRNFSDVQGAQLRVPSSELYVAMASGLGAQAVALPLGDVYTGLQTGAIEAMEGSPDDINKGGFGEVASYLTLDEHVFHPLSIVFNLDQWNSLSSEQQEIVQRAVDTAMEKQVPLLEQANKTALEELKAGGVEIITLEDKELWAQKVQPASQAFSEKFGEKGKFILDAMEKAAR